MLSGTLTTWPVLPRFITLFSRLFHQAITYLCTDVRIYTWIQTNKHAQTCTLMRMFVCMCVCVGSYLFVHLPDVVVLNWENNKATRIFTQQRLQRRVKRCCNLVHNCASFLGAVVLIFGCNRHFANVTNVLRQNFLAGALHGKTKADI